MAYDSLLLDGVALPGYPLPLGVSYGCDGVNFSVFSRHAMAVTLLLFETSGDQVAKMSLSLDPLINKTGDIWHFLSATQTPPNRLFVLKKITEKSANRSQAE